MSNEPRYTHLVRSYDGAGKPRTTLHVSLKEAAIEQGERENEGLFPVTVMPVTTEHIALTSRGEVVTLYKEPPGTRKAEASPRHGAGSPLGAALGTRKEKVRA